MGTVHQLPETFCGPEQQGRLPRFPRDRPENVQILRPRVGDRLPRDPVPLQPEGYVLLALIEALETRKGLHKIGNDAFQTIVAMHARWSGDPEVRRAIGAAISLMCAGRTGRCS